MTVVQPTPARFTVEDQDNSRRIVIPSRKVWYTIASTGFGVAVLTTGSVIWGIVLLAVLNSIIGPTNLTREVRLLNVVVAVIMLGAGGFWAFMGMLIVRTFLWHVAGRELVEVTPQSITLRRQVFNSGRPKMYLVEHIKDLRLSPPVSKSCFPIIDMWGLNLTRGWLAFDYGGKTIRFARGLEEAEGKQLLKVIEDALE